MAAKKLLFCLCANHPHEPHFNAIFLNFVRPNEASDDD